MNMLDFDPPAIWLSLYGEFFCRSVGHCFWVANLRQFLDGVVLGRPFFIVNASFSDRP